MRRLVVLVLALVLAAPAQAAYIVGTNRADNLRGTVRADTIRGLWGADELRGRRGPDVLRGDQGPDALWGGPGRDELWGGRGNDFLNALDGSRDRVNCGFGIDLAWIDLGIDVVSDNCEHVGGTIPPGKG